MRKVVREELVVFAGSMMKSTMQKFVGSRLGKVTKKIKSLDNPMSTLPDLQSQVEELQKEVTDKFDSDQECNDCLLKKLETNMAESMKDLVAKQKKTAVTLKIKYKKLAGEVGKAVKELSSLVDRVTKLENPKKKRCLCEDTSCGNSTTSRIQSENG